MNAINITARDLATALPKIAPSTEGLVLADFLAVNRNYRNAADLYFRPKITRFSPLSAVRAELDYLIAREAMKQERGHWSHDPVRHSTLLQFRAALVRFIEGEAA